MSTQEFILKLDRRIQELDEAKVIFDVAASIHARQIERMFDKGQKANGQIGAYNNKQIYASKKSFKNAGSFKGIGKTGKTKFKDGSPHKSMFLPQGYKQLKTVQGYEGAFVNLTYSADLRQDFATHLIIQNGSICSGVSRNINVKKIQGLKAKYGSDLFALTEAERKDFVQGAAAAVTNYLKQL